MPSLTRGVLGFVICVALLFSTFGAAHPDEGAASVQLPSASPASAGDTTYEPQTARLAGANRVETAVEVSKSGWTSSEWVVIAASHSFPDGLVGVGVAAALDAPILLSDREGLASTALAEIARLGSSKAVLLGGEGALSADVVQDLIGAGFDPSDIERIGGEDRYDTARLVAERVAALRGSPKAVVVATGTNWPDALAIAGWAGAQGYPILLTRRDTIPGATEEALESLRPESAIVMGGEGAVGEDVYLRLPEAFRIAGKDRYETAMHAAEHSFVFGHGFETVYVAVGTDYPDALAAAALAAKTESTLILTPPDALASATEDYLLSHCSSMDKLVFLGGGGAITARAEEEAIAAASVVVDEDFTELTPAAASAIETITPGGTIVFDDSSHVADYIDVGNVLAGDPASLDGGLLCEVIGVEESGGKRLVHTLPASVNDVIVKGSTTHVVAVLSDGDTIPCDSDAMLALSQPPTGETSDAARPGSSVAPQGWWDGKWHAGGSAGAEYTWPFHEDWNTSGTYGTLDITVDATLTVAGYVTINTNWQWAELREFDLSFTATEYFESKLVGTYDLATQKRWPIGNTDGYVIEEVDLEIVPDVISIPIQLRAKPYFELEGNAHAELTTGVNNWVWVRWDTWWTKEWGWGHSLNNQTGISYITPVVDAEASVRADLGCTIEVSIGSFGGPYLEPEGYLELDAQEHWVLGQKAELDWQLWGGADYRWGGEIDVLGYERTWADDRQSLYRRMLKSGHIVF